MNEFPEYDGYYWVYLTECTIKSLQIPVNRNVIVKIHTIDKNRYVMCFERINIWNRTDECSMKNFITNTKVRNFVKIEIPYE